MVDSISPCPAATLSPAQVFMLLGPDMKADLYDSNITCVNSSVKQASAVALWGTKEMSILAYMIASVPPIGRGEIHLDNGRRLHRNSLFAEVLCAVTGRTYLRKHLSSKLATIRAHVDKHHPEHQGLITTIPSTPSIDIAATISYQPYLSITTFRDDDLLVDSKAVLNEGKKRKESEEQETNNPQDPTKKSRTLTPTSVSSVESKLVTPELEAAEVKRPIMVKLKVPEAKGKKGKGKGKEVKVARNEEEPHSTSSSLTSVAPDAASIPVSSDPMASWRALLTAVDYFAMRDFGGNLGRDSNETRET